MGKSFEEVWRGVTRQRRVANGQKIISLEKWMVMKAKVWCDAEYTVVCKTVRFFVNIVLLREIKMSLLQFSNSSYISAEHDIGNNQSQTQRKEEKLCVMFVCS